MTRPSGIIGICSRHNLVSPYLNYDHEIPIFIELLIATVHDAVPIQIFITTFAKIYRQNASAYKKIEGCLPLRFLHRVT